MDRGPPGRVWSLVSPPAPAPHDRRSPPSLDCDIRSCCARVQVLCHADTITGLFRGLPYIYICDYCLSTSTVSGCVSFRVPPLPGRCDSYY